LEDLYYRWFDAIYHNDEEAVREVIATERYLEDFMRAASSHTYPRPPEHSEIRISDIEILRDGAECLVVFVELDLSEWLDDQIPGSTVQVMYPQGNSWAFASNWQHKGDLWEQDCEVEH